MPTTNIWLILHLISIILLVLGIIIPSSMIKQADGENRARRRWLIGAGLAAVITMCGYIIDKTSHDPDDHAIGGRERTPGGNTAPARDSADPTPPPTQAPARE